MIVPFQLGLSFIRFAEAFVYLIALYFLLSKKSEKSKEDPGYTLLNIYIYLFIFWLAYMILDIIIPLIITLSISEEFIQSLSEFPVVLIGYSIEYPSVFVANILRDFQLIFGFGSIICSLAAAFVIRNGEEIGIQKLKQFDFIFLLTVVMIFIIIFDMKQVVIMSPTNIKIKGSWDSLSPLGYLGFFFYISLQTYSTMLITYQYWTNKRYMDELSRTALRDFSMGHFFLALGMWYWVLMPLVLSVLNIVPPTMVFELTGHSIWMIAPIMFVFALKYRLNKDAAFEKQDSHQLNLENEKKVS